MVAGLGVAAAGMVTAEVSLIGMASGRAVFAVNGATRIVKTGQTVAPGLRLKSVDGNVASLEHNGRPLVLRVGQQVPGAPAGEQVATLAANPQGHFLVTGVINGQSVRFLVDTGATMVSLGAADARRLKLDLERGESALAQTAAGTVAVTRMRLDEVVIGDIELEGVDALVHENDLPIALLGMSFLNRTDMRREGTTLTLKRRY
jgi:aspartyl protease family protein